MLKDQKNIKVKILNWLLVAIGATSLTYLFYFIPLDVMHLGYTITGEIFNYDFVWRIKDVFPFWDAAPNEHLELKYYFFLVGLHLSHLIVSYLLLSCIGALGTLMCITVPSLDLYRQIYIWAKIYLFVQLYTFFSYVLWAGQRFQGWTIPVYIVVVFVLFFIRKTAKGWEYKPIL